MFDANEKEYLRKLVKRDLERFKQEEKDAVITDVTPAFLKGETEYKEFLEKLLEKLK